MPINNRGGIPDEIARDTEVAAAFAEHEKKPGAHHTSGEWAPILRGLNTIGIVTYHYRYGRWNRIGSFCIAYFQVWKTTIANIPATEQAIISNLPILSFNKPGVFTGGFLPTFMHGYANNIFVGGRIPGNTQQCELFKNNNPAGISPLLIGDITNTSNLLEGILFYEVNP